MIVALLTIALGVVALGLLVASALSKDSDLREGYLRIAMILTVVAVVVDVLSRMCANVDRPAAQDSTLSPGYAPMPSRSGKCWFVW